MWAKQVFCRVWRRSAGSGPIDVSVAIGFRLREETGMSDLFWPTDEQLARLRPSLSKKSDEEVEGFDRRGSPSY
jgi:hypothetical protein